MFSGIGGNDKAEFLSVSPRLLEEECDLRCDNATSSITSTSFLYCVSSIKNQMHHNRPIIEGILSLVDRNKDIN